MATKKKPTKKKKKKISKKELRRRAKKGWETRRREYGPSGRKSYVKEAATKKEEELGKRIQELEERNTLLETLSQFVDDSDWVRRDGSLAQNYSSVRHLGEATDIMLIQLNRSYYVNGDRDKGIVQEDLSLWYDQIEFFAERLDVEVREIYSLFYSP